MRMCVVAILVAVAIGVSAQAPTSPVTFTRLLHAVEEPQNWLTYSGSLAGEHYSLLREITPANVQQLQPAWHWDSSSTEKFEATPLVVDGVLYTVQAPNDVVALDAFTGRVKWTLPYNPGPVKVCCGRVNRGLAILGRTLFMGTLDAHLIAIDADSGKQLWDTTVADAGDPSCGTAICYSITHAPLVIKSHVLVGVAGGDSGGKGIRGFIAAFDAVTGKEQWRFHTVPAPGEPGGQTWPGDSWKIGGAGIWMTGTYDPSSNLTYWGTGNPNGTSTTRVGDNLYSDSVIALDADTGSLKWFYQFTPYDQLDWDAAEVPVLIDAEWKGVPRKLLVMANKNGLFYVFDRLSGEFLLAKPFAQVNWVNKFDDRGHPERVAGKERRATGAVIFPNGGATNWDPPSYSADTRLFYVPVWERGPEDVRFSGDSFGALRAWDPLTGALRWEFKVTDAWFHGVLTTASGLVFTGTDAGCQWREDATRITSCAGVRDGRQLNSNFRTDPALLPQGDFYALHARTGEVLWRFPLAATVYAAPISYSIGGRQFIAIAAGRTLYAFTLRH